MYATILAAGTDADKKALFDNGLVAESFDNDGNPIYKITATAEQGAKFLEQSFQAWERALSGKKHTLAQAMNYTWEFDPEHDYKGDIRKDKARQVNVVDNDSDVITTEEISSAGGGGGSIGSLNGGLIINHTDGVLIRQADKVVINSTNAELNGSSSTGTGSKVSAGSNLHPRVKFAGQMVPLGVIGELEPDHSRKGVYDINGNHINPNRVMSASEITTKTYERQSPFGDDLPSAAALLGTAAHKGMETFTVNVNGDVVMDDEALDEAVASVSNAPEAGGLGLSVTEA